MKAFGLKTTRDWIKAVLLLIGVVLFIYLVRRTGLRSLEINLARFGPWFIVTCALGGSFFFFQAAAWWTILKDFFQKVPLSHLLSIKIVSSAFNLVLPSASLGGDAMRAFMIQEHMPLIEGIPSVLFDKTIEFVASLIFLVSGLFLGLLSLHLPKALVISVIISLSITALITLLFILAQKAGLTKTLMKLGRFVPGAEGWAAKNAHHLRELDQSLSLLYSRSNIKALVPIGLNVLSRLAGVAEVMVIMAVLRAPINFMQALLISTVVTVGNTVFFVLPGQWGVMEGVYIVVLRSMGFPAAIGLSLSIIRRIRTLIFAGLGLALFALEKRRSSERGAS